MALYDSERGARKAVQGGIGDWRKRAARAQASVRVCRDGAKDVEAVKKRQLAALAASSVETSQAIWEEAWRA